MLNKDVQQRIRERAFAIWQAEGCAVGNDIGNWLRAEAEVLEGLAKAAGKPKKAAAPKAPAAKKPAAPKKAAAPKVPAAKKPAAPKSAAAKKPTTPKA